MIESLDFGARGFRFALGLVAFSKRRLSRGERTREGVGPCFQGLLGADQLLFGALTRENDAGRILQGGGLKQLVFVASHQPPAIMSAAMAVPSTRAVIFANAVSRLVEVSSLKGA